MVEEESNHSEKVRLFQLLLNEIATTYTIADRWYSYIQFWLGILISSIIAFATIGLDQWNWIVFFVGAYAFIMMYECAMRHDRASNIELALRSQLVRPIFGIKDDDRLSVFNTIDTLANKRRRIVSIRGYTDAILMKNKDLTAIIEFANNEASINENNN